MCLVGSQRAVVSVLVSHVCTEMCLFLLLMVTPRANCTFKLLLFVLRDQSMFVA